MKREGMVVFVSIILNKKTSLVSTGIVQTIYKEL